MSTTALEPWELELLGMPATVAEVVNEPRVVVLDLGARKAVTEPLTKWQAHARLDQLKAQFPYRRYPLTGVRHG